MRDEAAEIAQALVEDRSLPWHDMPAVGREIMRRWPKASMETIRRAIAIAAELTLTEPDRRA